MKLALKVYFWIFVLALLAALTSIWFWKMADYGWYVALLVILIPFHGYVFQKPHGRGEIWKAILAVDIIFYLVFAFYLDPNYGGYPPKSIGDYLLTVLIPLPAYIGAVLQARHK